MSTDRRLEAAKRLEELTVMAKQMVIDLRLVNNNYDGYRRVYWLRKELSKVVASLGGGVPRVSDLPGKYERLIES